MNTIATEVVRARKEHCCDLCLQPIVIGERYSRQFNVGDAPYTFRNHLYCGAVADEQVKAAGGGFSIAYPDGYMADDFDYWMSESWIEAEEHAANGNPYPWLVDGWER